MSQSTSTIQDKQLVTVISRFGQILAVYNNFDDAVIVVKDMIIKKQNCDIAVKFVQ